MPPFKINRILVPVDFSAASINALDTAAALARRHDATILLLNVIETPAPYGAGIEAMATQTGADAVPVTGLEVVRKSLRLSLVPFEVITITGNAAAAIVDTGSRRQADIIIMGAHGVSGYKEFFIGATACEVIRHSGCPVLTIPAQKKYEPFKKILFPVRTVPGALEKYDVVREIIPKKDATLKILGLAIDYENEAGLLKDLASQLEEKLKEDGVDATIYFRIGKAMAEEVLKIAALMEPDLVVITATVENLHNQVFVSPYARHIINHSRFPVLCVKPNDSNTMIQTKQELFTQEMPLYN